MCATYFRPQVSKAFISLVTSMLHKLFRGDRVKLENDNLNKGNDQKETHNRMEQGIS